MPPDENDNPNPLLVKTPVAAPPPKRPKKSFQIPGFHSDNRWNDLSRRASLVASIGTLFIFLLAVGAVTGYFIEQSRKPVPTSAQGPTVQTLSPSDLQKLGQIGTNLGTSNEVLDVSADALFRGQADVVGNFTVGGKLDATGNSTLNQLNVTGGLATSTLNVSGATTFQNALTVTGLATFGGLTVSGATNFANLTANTITVHNISISGPLTVGHLVTQGPTPGIAGGQDGSGGTVSISGNDTSGQINVNTGTSPGGTLATVTFKAAFGGIVHVQLTPLTSAAASAQAYVSPSAGSFVLHANLPVPASGQVLSFDYLVTQ